MPIRRAGPTVFDALPAGLPRLMSVGRLDIGTEGLLLLTNDGGLARVLELPDTHWLRRYRVRAHGHISQAELDRLKDGISVEGVNYGPIEATLEREQGSNVWLGFAIREGKNREVRNVLGALGLQVNRLIRIAFGPFELGDLHEGAVVEVETAALRAALGDAIAAQANCDFASPVIARGTAALARGAARGALRAAPRDPSARAWRTRAGAARTRRTRPTANAMGRVVSAMAARDAMGRGASAMEHRASAVDRRRRDGAPRGRTRSPGDRERAPRAAKPFRRGRAATTSGRRNRRGVRAAATPGARTMRRCARPIAARAAPTSKSPTRTGPTSAPASSRTARAAASSSSGSARGSRSRSRHRAKAPARTRPAHGGHRIARPDRGRRGPGRVATGIAECGSTGAID